LAVVGGTLFVGLIICILSFIPNRRTLKGSVKPNLYFWGDIAGFDSTQDYDNAVENSESEQAHLEAQNIQVSRIIQRKYKMFNMAINISLAAIVPPYWLWLGIYYGYKKIKKKSKERSK
jgi:hypothetical protein